MPACAALALLALLPAPPGCGQLCRVTLPLGPGNDLGTSVGIARHDAAYGIALQPSPGSEIVLGGRAFWTGAGTIVDQSDGKIVAAGQSRNGAANDLALPGDSARGHRTIHVRTMMMRWRHLPKLRDALEWELKIETKSSTTLKRTIA